MQGALTALKRSIIGGMRSLFLARSSFTSVPENQPPQSVTSAFFRIGSMTLASLGKRRPISMPVNPAERDWRRHSSSDTSSLSSARSSFHHAMGDMPSLAFMLLLQVYPLVCLRGGPHPASAALGHPLPQAGEGNHEHHRLS